MKKLTEDELKQIAYNCRKATFLIEKQQLGRITMREKLELKIHLAGCSVCRMFEQQSSMINQMAKVIFKTSRQSEPKLDERFKNKLKERIEEKLKKE